MSNSTSSGFGASPEPLRTARNAVGSAAEQIKATASGAYDAGAKASQYVGSTASEHPLTTLLITAGLAYLAGFLTSSPEGGSRTWRDSGNTVRRQMQAAAASAPDTASYARDWVGRTASSAADYAEQGARSAGNYAPQTAQNASDYVTQSARSAGSYITHGVREYPASMLLAAALVSGVLGYLLRSRNG